MLVEILKRLGNIYINVKFIYFQLLRIFVVNFSLLRRSEKAMQFLFDRILRPVVASCAASGRTEAITQVPWLSDFSGHHVTLPALRQKQFLLSFFLLEERGMQTIISDRKNRRLGWYLLVAKLAKLMKIRLPELHGMLLSDITEHSRKKKKHSVTKKLLREIIKSNSI